MLIKQSLSVPAFEAIVRQAARFASKASTLPILQNILLKGEPGKFTLRATDLSNYFTVTFPHSEGANFGETTVNAANLQTFLKIIKNKTAIEIHIADTKLFLDKISVRTLPAEEFPPGYARNYEETYRDTFDLGHLNEEIRKVFCAVSNDEARPILGYIQMSIGQDDFQLAATNGWIIAVNREVPNLDRSIAIRSYLLHRDVMAELAALERSFGPALVTITGLTSTNNPTPTPEILRISAETLGTKAIPPLTWTIETTLGYGQFPSWEAIFPTANTITVEVPVGIDLETANVIRGFGETTQILAFNSNLVHFLYIGEEYSYHDTAEIQTPVPQPIIFPANANFHKDILSLAKSNTFQLLLPAVEKLEENRIITPVVLILPGVGSYVIMPIHLSGPTAEKVFKLIQ